MTRSEIAFNAIRKANEEGTPAKVSGVTTRNIGHTHTYTISKDGDGRTNSVLAGKVMHYHEIAGFMVQSSEVHTHLLDRVYEGAKDESEEHGMQDAESIKTAVDHLKITPNYYRIVKRVVG